MKNLVLHIPHSSKIIPAELKEQFCLTDNELNSEI